MSEKAIFLDRDDTLIEDPGYINHPDQVRLLDGVAEALTRLRSMGYKLIVVSNQSGIARGILTEKVLGTIHDKLIELLAQKGSLLDHIYYCPYHPDGAVAKYRKQSDWRKPESGMLFAAAEEMDIELAESWMIGNSTSDIEAGIGAGCRTILIDSPSHSKRPKPGDTQPDYISVNIREAVNIIKQHQNSERKVNNPKQPKSFEPVEPSRIMLEPVEESEVRIEQPTPEPAEEPEIRIEQPAPEPVEEPETPIEQPTPEPIVQQPEQELPLEPAEPPLRSSEPNSGNSTDNLLTEIIVQLKAMQRTEMFGEFSAMRLLAWILQGIVLFCLLMSIWLVLDSNRSSESVLVPLGFAVVLQLMALTFYTIQGQK